MNENLKRVTDMANLLIRQSDRVAVLEQDLSDAKAAMVKTQREDLPEVMREFGLLDFTLSTGMKIEIKEDISCGITEDRKVEALRWLNEHGFGGLIKTVVSVEFGQGEIESAEELAIKLQGDGLPATANEIVHASTLKSFIKEQLENGQSIPFNLFGVHPFSFAKIVTKKGARK